MPQVSHIHLYCAGGNHTQKQKGTTNPNLEKTDTKKEEVK